MIAKQNYTQTNRHIAISSPLGEDVLLLHSISGTEAISRLFKFDLDLFSEDDSIDFNKLVGQRVTARLFLADRTERYWNGFISRVSQGGQFGDLTIYHAEMVPWLWFLTRTAENRVKGTAEDEDE